MHVKMNMLDRVEAFLRLLSNLFQQIVVTKKMDAWGLYLVIMEKTGKRLARHGKRMDAIEETVHDRCPVIIIFAEFARDN